AMKGDECGYVDAGNAIAIGKTERLVVEIRQHTLQAAAGHGLFAGVDERHAPGLGETLMHFHAVVDHVEGYVGGMQEIVREILLDDVTLVAQANDEVVDAMRRVDLHDVPENRL